MKLIIEIVTFFFNFVHEFGRFSNKSLKFTKIFKLVIVIVQLMEKVTFDIGSKEN